MLSACHLLSANRHLTEKLTMNLKEQAQKILEQNGRGGYTVPSPRLYPFQWNWDSGFIALGLSYFNPQNAFNEIRNMFKGQWSNGMLPHINFHDEDPAYFPGPGLWDSKKNPLAPKFLATSGITQPPVYGFVVQMLAERFWQKDENFGLLLKDIYPKMVASHRYLYQHRDPLNEGLPYIHHNWESADNSPLWDEALANIDLKKARDVSALRRDLKNVDAAQRPTNDNYNRYIYLVDLFKGCGYDDDKIFQQSPFLIQDMLFITMLVRSNEGLIHLASLLGEDASEIKEWNAKTIASLNKKCWNDEARFYFDFDLKLNKQIPIKVSNGFMAMFAGVCTMQQAEQLKEQLVASFGSGRYMLCASCAINEPAFDPVKYWRGPIWININWMLYQGLKRYGFVDEAMQVKKETLMLIEENGFHEYFNPLPGLPDNKRGLGGNSFSWTAALYLDLVYSNGNNY